MYFSPLWAKIMLTNELANEFSPNLLIFAHLQLQDTVCDVLRCYVRMNVHKIFTYQNF